jgi:hypothetical protein
VQAATAATRRLQRLLIFNLRIQLPQPSRVWELLLLLLLLLEDLRERRIKFCFKTSRTIDFSFCVSIKCHCRVLKQDANRHEAEKDWANSIQSVLLNLTRTSRALPKFVIVAVPVGIAKSLVFGTEKND